MALIIKCPACRRKYRVGDNVEGQSVRCQNCGESFDAQPRRREAPADDNDGRLITVQCTGAVTVVRINAPRITTENVEAVGDKLLALAKDAANKKMVLNLARVEFLFSTALGKIVALEKKLQSHGGALRLCGLQPVVRETLESAGLTMLLDVFDDEQQALAEF